MTHKYTAKVYLEDDEILLNEGDDVEELLAWMHEQAEVSFYEIKGEIFDNQTNQIVKQFQYSPPTE